MHILVPLLPRLVVVHLVLLRSPTVPHTQHVPYSLAAATALTRIRWATLRLFLCLFNYFRKFLLPPEDRDLSSPLVDLDSGKTNEILPLRRKIHQPLSHRLSHRTHVASVVCTDKRTHCSTCDLCLTASHGARHDRKYIPDNSFALSFPIALHCTFFLFSSRTVSQRYIVSSLLRLFAYSLV